MKVLLTALDGCDRAKGERALRNMIASVEDGMKRTAAG
jgi:hypothetical protein